jgi:hypothetical protein
METLAELGPIGLVLLLILIGLPLVAGWRARRQPFVFAALGAYAAFTLHAGIDWDWELPAVTLPALVLGALCVRSASENRSPVVVGRLGRTTAVTGFVAISIFALVALIGNTALARSRAALLTGDFVQAERQAQKAQGWMPWSSEAWQRLGEAQVETLQLVAARESFRHAIAKEPNDWLLWYELEGVEGGSGRREAAQHVIRLNPHSPEASALRSLLQRGRL